MRTILFQIYNILITNNNHQFEDIWLIKQGENMFRYAGKPHSTMKTNYKTFCNKYLLGFGVGLILVESI